jgi:valyl-tRNA synthetase
MRRLKDEQDEGNVVNPLTVMSQFGTDALRFALSTGTSPGNDQKLSTTRLESSLTFANKIWNAARFVIKSIETDNLNLQIEKINCRWKTADFKPLEPYNTECTHV